MNEQDAREAYFELKVIDEQMRQLQHQIAQIEGHISEFENAIKTIGELGGKEGEETFVPVSSAIFAKAKMGDTGKLVVNVGAGIAVEKSPEETMRIIEKQIGELGQYREQMMNGLQLLSSRAEEIQKLVSE